MSARPSVSEVAGNFSAFLDRVARGERFVLMRGSEPVAELTPIPGRLRLRDLPAILESLPRLSPEELSSLEADLANARTELGRIPLRDPWES